MLTRRQFDILVFLEKCRQAVSQRDIASSVGISLGLTNKTLKQLTELGYLENGVITEQGLLALQPYRAKRAIFIAAGFGSRLVPITLNTPKPLVRVKGVRIIDTLLDAIIAAGIEEIIIVRGYLSEQFDQLLYKYPQIKFVENPNFNESNNISSMMYVRHLLKNAYVLDGDLILYNPTLITKYHYTSNYLGAKIDLTDDWCLETKNGIITRMVLGGQNCYHMFGISYWNEQDGERLSEHIQAVYNMPGGKERYWDQVALDCFVKEYQIEIRPCTFNDIVEIDTYTDLKKIDGAYM